MYDEQDFIKELQDPKTQNAAFEKLIADFGRPLYRHIRNMVIDHDDTDDILQNTFVKVFRHLNSFKGESKLFSWIYRIATNEALTFLRQRARMRGASSEELQVRLIENLTADEYFDGDAASKKLHLAIALLPEKQQLVFRMKYFQELKYDEISEILGTSVGGLKASYHHAVKKIEEYVNRD